MKKNKDVGINLKPSKTRLGKFIRRLRIKQNISQQELSKFCGLFPKDISHIETGVRLYLKDYQINLIAEFLGCNPEELRKRIPVKPISQPKSRRGRFIRLQREKLGMTIEDFANRMKMSIQKAKRMELRRSRNFNYREFRLLLQVLKIDKSELSKFLRQSRKKTTSMLGQTVQNRRRELGFSLVSLAQRLDVTPQFVNLIELGRTPLKNDGEMITKLAKILNLNLNLLKSMRLKKIKESKKYSKK